MIVTLKLTKNHNRVPTHRRGVGGRDLDRAADGVSRNKCSSRARVIHRLSTMLHKYNNTLANNYDTNELEIERIRLCHKI